MDTRNVIINSITNLYAAKQAYLASQPPFTLVYQQTPTAPDINYKIYRYIGDYPDDCTVDPVVDLSEMFKLIASTTSTTYSDTMNDLNINGFTLSNGYWFDINGNNVLEQIFSTKRKIYYKVVAQNQAEGNFNTTPFLFIGHDNGILECRSTIRQVKYNTLYDEGGVVWSNPPTDYGLTSSYAIRSISVDHNYIDRQYTVWVAYTNEGANTSVILRLAVKDGTVVNTYNIPFAVYSVRVDPSDINQGDCIVTGKNYQLIRCTKGIDNGLTYFGTVPYDTDAYGGYATTLVRGNSSSNDIINAYSVWGRHYVLRSGVTIPDVSYLYSEVNYGQQYLPQYNPQGITNGGDGTIFCNARILTTVSWSEWVVTSTVSYETYSCCK